MEKTKLDKLLRAQKDEADGHLIYLNLADKQKSPENKQTLLDIASEESNHYHILKQYTQKDVKPDKLKIQVYDLLFLIFGITFAVKLMERSEKDAQLIYRNFAPEFPELARLQVQEEEHEDKLISLLKEDKLNYLGAIILGMNDALIELTGALAGFTLALQNSTLIAVTGSITGIAAALSMAASEYLAVKAESKSSMALKASVYTGFTYLITVVLLILPYLLIKNVFIALIVTLSIAVIIIAVFNFYFSIVKEAGFKKKFGIMVGLSLGIAAFSFFVGYILKSVTDF
jgi:VIT1/CCC1 family predicted Fe2+/Mn2+ transporter